MHGSATRWSSTITARGNTRSTRECQTSFSTASRRPWTHTTAAARSSRRAFQETTKVLNEAAILGKVDPLEKLKENLLAGQAKIKDELAQFMERFM